MRLLAAIVVFGTGVVVPIARPIARMRVHGAALAVAAALLIPSLWLAPGTAAAAFALPWLLVCAAHVLVRAGAVFLDQRRCPCELARDFAAAYLAIAAGWLVLSRGGIEPTGIREPLVELTAVHFTYAGFATMCLAAATYDAIAERVPKLAKVAVALGAAGPPLVALGFLSRLALFQIGGALVMTAAVWLIGGLTALFVVPQTARLDARALLVVSVVAVLLSMAPAVLWAIAQHYPVPGVWGIPTVARTHGVLNAFGFVLCGLLGHRLSARVGLAVG